MNNNLNSPGQSKTRRGKNSGSDAIWNVLTIVMLLGSACLVLYFVNIIQHPASPLNPLPPPTDLPTAIPPTLTPLPLAPTWTLTVTAEPTSTSTPRPTFTLEPSATVYTLATATSILTPTKTVKPTGVPFTATISYLDSSVFLGKSCDSLLVGGQVQDAGNNPVVGMIVKLGGGVPGKIYNAPDVKLTGIAPAYGPSGFEFNLGIAPVASNNTLWIQLYDQVGSPLSSQVFLQTFKDCKKNVIDVRFQQK